MAYAYNSWVPGYLPLRYDPVMAVQKQGIEMQSQVNSPSANYPQINPNSQTMFKQDQGPEYEMKSKFGYVGINPKYRAFSDTVQSIGAFFANRKTQQEAKDYQRLQSNPLLQLPTNPNTSQQSLYGTPEYKGGGWIKKAINPAHKGWCTPLSNPHCTGHRRALALRFKHHKLEEGGEPEPKAPPMINNLGHRAEFSDMISYNIVNSGGKENLNRNRNILFTNAVSDYGESKAKKLVMDMYLYNKRPEVQKLGPQQKIQSYYGINSNDPDIQSIKNEYKNFGYNPGVIYQNSPDVNVQDQSIASRAEGGPTSSKAKEMLRDGTAQGHKLTDKQKRYFGWIAGGKKAEGGFSDEFTPDDADELRDLKEELEDRLAKSETQGTPQEEAQETPEQEQIEQEEQFTPPQDQGLAEAHLNQNSVGPGEDENSEEEPNPVEPIKPGSAPIAGRQGSGDIVDAFKNGISNVENANYNEKSKNSSAFGKYQIIDATREGIRKQFFSKINKQDFDNAYKTDPKFQERVMDVYSSHLLSKYDNPHEAAIAYFLGEGNSGRVNQPSYRPTKNNATVSQYLNRFDKGYHFKEGGEYNLTEVQIAQLRKQGYQIEII